MFHVEGFEVTLHTDVINAGGIENFVRGVVFGEGAEELLNSLEVLGEYIHIAKFNRSGENYELDISYSNDLIDYGTYELSFIVRLLKLNVVEINGERDDDIIEVIHEWPVEVIDTIENDVKTILN